MIAGSGARRTHGTDEVTMPQLETGRFTITVFRDTAAAELGIGALTRQGFPGESLSIIAKESPTTADLIQRMVGKTPAAVALAGVGEVLAAGPIVAALEGAGHDLAGIGLARALKRAGFQAHDGQIFEKLTERGGVLVAVRSESRAADALTTFHCHGGGNAAIGAWAGRL
jgi:hypothetical protein